MHFFVKIFEFAFIDDEHDYGCSYSEISQYEEHWAVAHLPGSSLNMFFFYCWARTWLWNTKSPLGELIYFIKLFAMKLSHY